MDGLGSVRGVVSDGLSPLESRQYEPYGEPFGKTGDEQTQFGFTGEWTDDNDLLYLRARYLDPAMGRFFQMDPLEGDNQQSQSINAYAYALGNPIRYVDPTGEQGGEGILELVNSLGPLLTALLALGGVFAEVGAAIAEVAAVAVTLPGLLAIGAGILVGAALYFGWQYLFDSGFHYNLNKIVEAPPEVTWEVLEQTWQTFWEDSGLMLKPPQLPQLPPGAGEKAIQLIAYFLILSGVFLGIAKSAYDKKICDPKAFKAWWDKLDEVKESYKPNDPAYKYEQRVARGKDKYGNYGMYSRDVPIPDDTIAADGINPDTCGLVDAKYAGPNTQFRLNNTPKWIKAQISDEFRRYRLAVITPNNKSGAQPREFIVRTNDSDAKKFFEQYVKDAGFIIGVDAVVELKP